MRNGPSPGRSTSTKTTVNSTGSARCDDGSGRIVDSVFTARPCCDRPPMRMLAPGSLATASANTAARCA